MDWDLEVDNWYDVDNVAKIFLATHTKRDTRSLRVSCTLKDKVEPSVLNAALMLTIKARPQFQVRIRRGLFWHYIEPTSQLPMIAEESDRLCPILYGRDYKGVLHYQVTYFDKRINFELFHALSDGTGAMDFLNVLVLNYLKLLHPDKMTDVSLHGSSSAYERERDSYDQFYDDKSPLKVDSLKIPKVAYQIQGRQLPYNQLQFFEVTMPSEKVVAKAKRLGVSVTSYISAMVMMAIRSDMSSRQKDKAVAISLPVNLRAYYDSQTSRNFFNSIIVSHVFETDDNLASLAREFDAKLRANLEPEAIRNQMNSLSKYEHLFVTRMVPLMIKQFVVRFFARMQAKQVSAVVSNLGQLNIPDEMSQYIDGFSAYCSYNGLFMTLSSYKGDFRMGISSKYANTGVLRNFIKLLRKEEIDVRVDASEVIK